MKKILLSILLFSLGTAIFCKTWTITNSGTTFSPSTITITSGDSVEFTLASIHNAVEVSKTTWDANGNSPVTGFSVNFGGGVVLPAMLPVGTHYFVCVPHASIGMKGTIIVQSATDIADNSLKTNISIFPNPSNGKFQLKMQGSQLTKNYGLEIYDIQGKKIYVASGLKLQNTIEIDISDYSRGIYFVKLYNQGATYYKKIVVR